MLAFVVSHEIIQLSVFFVLTIAHATLTSCTMKLQRATATSAVVLMMTGASMLSFAVPLHVSHHP